jgi:hypothetical protein
VQGLQGVEWSLDPKRKPVGQHLHTTEANLMRINLWRLSSYTYTESKFTNWPMQVHSLKTSTCYMIRTVSDHRC